ncbi:UvrD-helicase domain-containing protein [soil metagenome]
MTTEITIPDQYQRQRALATDTSFIVQAPAGSGKTELLTQRFLALLAEVEKAPEEIIAITFTRKAAAEMQARILAALHKALEQEKPEAAHALQTWQLARRVLARDQECGWELLHNPNRLRIQTIDSLCASLVRRMPLLASFGAAPQIIEDASVLYQHAVRTVLHGLENSETWSDSLESLLLHLDNDHSKVEQLLLNMLARREQWLPHILGCNARTVLELALQHIVIAAMQKVQKRFPFEFVEELLILAEFAASNLQQHNANPLLQLPATKIDALEQWQQIATLLLTQDRQWRKTVNKNQGFPAASASANVVEKQQLIDMKQRMLVLLAKVTEHESLRFALEELLDAPPPYYNEQQWCIVDALVNILPTLVAALQLEFQECGQVDHAEIMLKALQSLGEPEAPTDLALILDHQIRHLLVDEFQDTSASQFRLLQLLTAGWENNSGRSLFLVGDPMQSIYRFRKAEVGIFLRAWNEDIGSIRLETLLLSSNFRSEAGIVNWINNSFKTILPSENDIETSAVAYQTAVAIDTFDNDTAVQTHPLIDVNNQIEADTIVNIVKATQAHNPDDSIAILVMARSHLEAIIPLLQQQNMPFRAVEIENLFHRMVIQDLYSLTCALLHPGDRLAWLAILRAPWCGLTLTDLHAIVQGQTELITIWQQLQKLDKLNLTADATERLSCFVTVIKSALKQRRRSSLRAWIESVWLALGGPACVSHALDLENAQAFFKLLEQQEQGGEIADMHVFATRLQKLTAHANQDPTTKLEIMTIHKAKGLEFDCVILPGLHRPARLDEHQLLLWAEQPQNNGENDLIIAPIKATGTDEDAIYDYLRRLEAQKAYHEAGRLLYVAATRAKKALHLIAQTRVDEKNTDEIKKPSNGSLLGQLWKQLEPTFKYCLDVMRQNPQTASVKPNSIATHYGRLTRLTSTWHNPLLIHLPLLQRSEKTKTPAPLPGLSEQEQLIVETLREPSPLTPLPECRERGTELLRIVGIATHYFLQHISKLDINQFAPDWITSQQQLMHQVLINQGLAKTDLALGVSTVSSALQNILQDTQGRWILDHKHEEARSELSISAMLNNELMHLIIDRTFIDNGTRWIIDYKIADYRGTDLPGFLDQQQQLYYPQLQQYAAAMNLLDERPIRLGLYFPLLQAWREIVSS